MKPLAMLRCFVLFAWLAVVAAFIATPRTAADSRTPELAMRAQALLKARCYTCHGANGVARKNVFVLDHARLLAAKIIIPGDENSRLLKVVESGEMPFGGPELSGAEKELLRDWILAGAPSWETEGKIQVKRERVTEAEVLRAIQEDLSRTSERTRPFLRYFSTTHLFNAGSNTEQLETFRVALAKLLNSLSWHREIAAPMPVNPLQTVFRIDLRDYQWTATTWDSLLQVYPYGIRNRDAEVIKLLSGADAPYLRADWFIANASEPPLYNDLLGLPQTMRELERMLGIDTARNLEEEKNVARAGFRASGVSQNNRVVERHISPYGAYWKSYDFRNNLDTQNIFRDPVRLHPAGGEVIFNLPNGMQGYFLADGAGQRLDLAPIDIVANRNNPDEPIIRNGRSCMSCHFEGVKLFTDEVRATVKTASFNASDQERAAALYPPQEALDNFIEKDRRRFREAMEQITATLPNHPNAESITMATRRFQADLTPAQAAAEAGLDLQEFLLRVQISPRLNELGFQQVLVANGGIKRDLWERHFGEVVRQLALGAHIAARRGVRNAPSWESDRLAHANRFNQAQARTNPFDNRPDAILKAARFVAIKSRTMFLKHRLLAAELRKVQDFQSLELEVTEDTKQADLAIELDRPPFTFIYQYTVINPATGVLLMKGDVTAFNGEVAAPKIAKLIINRIQTARASSAK